MWESEIKTGLNFCLQKTVGRENHMETMELLMHFLCIEEFLYDIEITLTKGVIGKRNRESSKC